MTANEIRKKYLEYFEKRQHAVIPSASLVPENDPTVLFTTAGMHPLVPFLLGQEHPKGKRLVNYQKCIRTGDIEEVGDNTHLTFFEMLGNWSLGDYFKKEAIEWSWNFLTGKEWLGIDPDKLAVTCFEGSKEMGVDKDEESAEIWKGLGVPESRIAFLGADDNWWGPAGQTGPCGPDTEMFYWSSVSDPVPEKFDPKDERWVEIWNDVFMQYNKSKDGKFEPLKQRNVDTGMGLERVTAVLQGLESVYDTELFAPIVKKFEELSKNVDHRSSRIVADHARAAVFMLGDGVLPSNLDRGYILRRLIRRAVRHGRITEAPKDFLVQVANVVIDIFSEYYPKLAEQREQIIAGIDEEVEKFERTLEKGIREFEKLLQGNKVDELLSGKEVFDLFSTYGFPLELTQELARERGIDVDERGFWQEFEKHQDLSRTATAGTFKGGLADHSEEVVQLHTTTHLMQAALRKVLGEHVYQKGSNITKDRTRFDFAHDAKMTDEQKAEVERLVNEWIAKDYQVKKEILPIEKARKLGAIGLFGEKYGDEVSIYTVYDPKTDEVISREFCGGPHVEHTGAIKGKFKLKKEQSASAGVRRVKGVLEKKKAGART